MKQLRELGLLEDGWYRGKGDMSICVGNSGSVKPHNAHPSAFSREPRKNEPGSIHARRIVFSSHVRYSGKSGRSKHGRDALHQTLRVGAGPSIFGFVPRPSLRSDSHSTRIQLGMTGFDGVISRISRLRSGMATVPVTHMLHPIDAKSSILARAFGTRFQRQLAPAYVLAA